MHIKKILKYSFYLFMLPVALLSRIVPKNDKIWVFGAWLGMRYSDNAKYLFKHVHHYQNIKAVWITKNKDVMIRIRKDGNGAFLSYSPIGIYYMLIAKVAIVSTGSLDLNGALIYGAFKVNLWHGAPMKKILNEQNKFNSRNILKRYIRELISPFFSHVIGTGFFDMIVVTSDCFKSIMASTFRVSPNKVKVLGYPRNDVLFNKNHVCKYMEELKSKFGYPKVLSYLPTFRGICEQDDTSKIFKKFEDARKAIEVFLEETHSVLLVKFHFVDQEMRMQKHLEAGTRIVFADKNDLLDINDALPYVDVLITDYSGVYFDYLLLNRPVIFAALDLEEYVQQPGLYEDYSFYVAGPVAKSWAEVIEYAQEATENPQKFEDVQIKKNNIFNKYHDGNNSMRVFNAIIKEIS